MLIGGKAYCSEHTVSGKISIEGLCPSSPFSGPEAPCSPLKRDQETFLPILEFIGTALLALEGDICYFEALGLYAMKQVSHCYFLSIFF